MADIPASKLIPRPAATLILLRPGAGGAEVLMIQRTQSAAFLGGAYVFPGGALDAQDADTRIMKRIVGLRPEQADARLKLPSGGLSYYVAAIRECFEERGEIELVFATQHTLKDIGRFDEPRKAFEYAASLPEIETNRACRALGKDGEKIFRHLDPQYHEIHWSDPEETGQTTYELIAGAPKRLDRLVTRIIAPNPGAMTGPGTNSYLVGAGDLAVIDPGPDIASHLEVLLSEGKNRIRWIVCTHTHLDHSPAAAALKAASRAP